MKKKILYIVTKSNWGGAQRYVFDMAVAAHEAGADVVVAYGGTGELAAKLHEKGIRGISLAKLERDISIADISAYKTLKKLVREEKPDVIHLNSSKVGILGAMAARGAASPKIIFTAHGWAFNEERPWWQKIPIALAHYLTIALSHKTVAVSQAVVRGTRWMPFVSHKIVLIYNGISEPVLLPKEKARETLIQKLPENTTVPSTALWIGTLSELTWNKGLHTLVRAAGILARSGVSFALFIMGEGEERAFLQMLIDDEKLNSCVFLVGHVTQGSSYLNALDIFVLSSYTESLAYALIEAGYAGLPVVATAVGGIPEIAENNSGALLVPPNDTHALAAALKKMLEDSELRKKLGEALRVRVRERFSLVRAAAETLALY